MFLSDKLFVDSKRRTGDGYLAVNARVARAGNVQLYSGSEVGKPGMATVRVYRPADEVFSADTMHSIAHKPVTLGHPAGAVTAVNWRSVAKGWVDGEVARDGEFIRVSMMLADAELIAAIDHGTSELSMGYDCSLQWESGVSPRGEAYDAIQRGIRSNHIACVDRARGGPELRIADFYSTDRKALEMMTDGEIRTMRDSVKSMTASEAAKLPIYDNVRGALMGGGPAEVHCALVDGARPDPVNDEKIDRMAHQVLYEHRVGNAWRGADNVPPFKAKHQDNGQAAYEKRLADAWKTI